MPKFSIAYKRQESKGQSVYKGENLPEQLIFHVKKTINSAVLWERIFFENLQDGWNTSSLK